jgi:VanZ family protein
MRPLFTFLSISYIAAIFLLADSPAVSEISAFNPYSLLHIPLYGIFTLLLILSFSKNSTNPKDSINPINRINYLIAGVIALVIAVADEIHQAYIPSRKASVSDVFLDIIGIVLCIIIFKRIEHTSGFSKIGTFLHRTK